MVALLILPRADLPPHERPELEHLDDVPDVEEVLGRDHTHVLDYVLRIIKGIK